MTDIASLDLAEPEPTTRRRRASFSRFSNDWTLADWVVGTASILLAAISASFFCWSYVVSIRSPDYFREAALANMPPKLDPIQTGSIDTANAMPAPEIVRLRDPAPEDYQIVMVYGGEALLATRNELMRVKVGSNVPGLGVIREIGGAQGASVVGETATLRTAAAAAP